MKATRKKKGSDASAPGTPTVAATAVNINRDESLLETIRIRSDDDQKSDCTVLKTRNRTLLLGTWNVRTLAQPGKYENLLKEAGDLNVDILGISETRLIDCGENSSDDNYTFLNSGGESHEHGVGFLSKRLYPNL